MCSIEDGLTFLSGCHAGCKALVNETWYEECLCITSSAPAAAVVTGPCAKECNYIYALAVILFFQVLFTFMGTMPGLVAGLR